MSHFLSFFFNLSFFHLFILFCLIIIIPTPIVFFVVFRFIARQKVQIYNIDVQKFLVDAAGYNTFTFSLLLLPSISETLVLFVDLSLLFSTGICRQQNGMSIVSP